MVYTTANFLDSVARQAFLPTGQSTFSTSDILEVGDEITKRYILKHVMAAREDYYITYKDYAITEGTNSIRIPSRSIGAGVRQVHLLDANSRFITELNKVTLDRPAFQSSSDSGTPRNFYFRGDKIVLSPTPSATNGYIRIYYAIRPGNLIETTSAAVISAINTSTNVVTVTTIPSTWATGNSFDLISQYGSQMYLDNGTDLTSTLISGNDITLPSLPSDLAVGDRICLAGYSPLIQMPADLHPLFSTLVAAQMCIAMGIDEGATLLKTAIQDLEVQQNLLTPRDIGTFDTIIPEQDF